MAANEAHPNISINIISKLLFNPKRTHPTLQKMLLAQERKLLLVLTLSTSFQTVLLAVPGKIETRLSPTQTSPRLKVDYPHQHYLDANQTVLFKWRIGNSSEFLPQNNSTTTTYNNVNNSNDVIVGKLSIPTLGWVALGWSPNGGMPGANMLVMWVDSDTSRAHVEDRYATDFVEPLKIDNSVRDHASNALPDVLLAFDGQQNSTHTTVHFVRWLDAGCKNLHDISITPSAMHVIYAFNDQDPVNGHIAYHGPTNRGTKTLYLTDDVNGAFERDKSAAARDGKPLTYVADNFKVPAVDTLYQCTYHQFPEITQDIQIVGFEPIVQVDNIDLVHHFLVHLCDYEAFANLSDIKAPSFACYDTPPQQLDANFSKCFGNDIWAWGVGGEGSYFPHDIGYQLTSRDSRRFFLLEIHYNNLAQSAQRVDSSGFRMLINDNKVLRPQHASAMIISAQIDESIVIPGNTPSFTTTTLCHDHCTKTYMPENGTKMFSVFLHSHLLGKSLALRHFRDGVELPVILSDPTYDFNYQQYRPTNATILPGDRLVAECNYSSTERTMRHTSTLGGLSTRNEMCTVVVFVSPPAQLQGCSNQVDVPYLSMILNTTDIIAPNPRNSTWDEKQKYRHKMAKRLKSISWAMPDSLPLVKKLQDFYLNTNQTWVCLLKNGQFDVGRDTVLPNNKWYSFQQPESSCSLPQ